MKREPVWITYWGLIPMTRRGYLVTLTMAAAVAAIVVLYCGLAGWLPPLRTLWDPSSVRARPNAFGWIYRHLWLMTVVCLVAQVIDTCLVLRKFAEKEREQAAEEARTSEAIQQERR